jgi:hypothetical protein
LRNAEKNFDCGYADLQCRFGEAEVVPSSCGVAIAGIEKYLGVPTSVGHKSLLHALFP